MEIIKYQDFNNLRLENFVPNKQDIQSLDDFEFMNAIWAGQSLGFTEWLKSTTDSNAKSISLDFNELSDISINKILETLNLEVAKGMTGENIIKIFGHPNKIENFISDRVTYEYIIGSTEKYYLSLTIHDIEGLIYLVLMNHTDTIRLLEQQASH